MVPKSDPVPVEKSVNACIPPEVSTKLVCGRLRARFGELLSLQTAPVLVIHIFE
jgi:hypothetical protein